MAIISTIDLLGIVLGLSFRLKLIILLWFIC